MNKKYLLPFPDDTNANLAYAIKEKIKEKIVTDEVNHE